MPRSSSSCDCGSAFRSFWRTRLGGDPVVLKALLLVGVLLPDRAMGLLGGLADEEATGDLISGIEPPRLFRDARGGMLYSICSTSLRLLFGERDFDRPAVGGDEERVDFS